MKAFLYTTIFEAVLVVVLALTSGKSESQKPIYKAIKNDTIPNPNVVDSIAILDSVYTEELNKVITSNKKMIEIITTIKQTDKKSQSPAKKPKKEIVDQDTAYTKNDYFNTAEDYISISQDTVNSILIIPVVKKKNLWQKFKSIFKPKNKDDGKIIESKILQLQAEKEKAPFWKKWWVKKLILFLQDLLIEILASRYEEEEEKLNKKK
ncbi:MAG: hypothetical protein IPJ81_17935 [Chitinophagaceae bacterium]|nr:hypothetical protein [Chitinophagaceae bacterium]